MLNVLIVALATTGFTAYPEFGDGFAAKVSPPAAVPQVTIEAVVDHGPIAEVVVRCGGGSGTAVISYSKIEKLYCSSRQPCSGSLATVAAALCEHRLAR